MVLVGRHIPGKTHVVIDAEDGALGRQITQGLDCVEAEDQDLNELFKAHLGLIVFSAMRFEPFMIIVLAKSAQKIEDRLELRHENRLCSQALDNFSRNARGRRITGRRSFDIIIIFI
jgi:hypothetical protein